MDLPEQEELRRRMRAARALRDLTVEKLAERIPGEHRLGVRTLRKLESGERDLTAPVLELLAIYVEVPMEWFTVPDVGAAVGGTGGSVADRLAALEQSQAALWAQVQAPPRRGAVRHEPRPSNDDPAPGARSRRGQTRAQ